MQYHKIVKMIICFVLLFGLFGRSVALSSGANKFKFMNPDTSERVQVYYYKPKAFDANTPVTMVMHGRKRNARSYRDSWEKLAEQYNIMILAPLISYFYYPNDNGLDRGNVFNMNKEKNPIKKWSFSVPDRVFAAFQQRETTNQRGYTLYGHGGGAQFVTRFALMMPKSNACHVIAANSGYYTYPNRTIRWPYGIEGAKFVSDAQIDKFLRKPITLMLGDNDKKRSGVIRVTKRAKVQCRNRRQRGESFFKDMQVLAKKHDVKSPWKLIHVPHAGHSDAEMCPSAARYITPFN